MRPLDERREWVYKSDPEFSVADQCRMASVSRSSVYYRKETSQSTSDEVMKVMDKLYTQDCTLGTRRYVETLKDYGFQMGRDRVRALMRKMNICAVYRKPRTTVIDPATYKFPYLLRGYKTERPNEVWSIDMSYIPMRHGFMYLFAIIDVHSRYLISWGLSNSMESGWVVKLIKSAIEKHGKPRIINSDQGSQFTSEEYVKTIKEFEDIRISMDGKGRAIDNVWIERFFRTLKHEHVYLQPSNNGHDLHRSIKTFVHYYNNQRKHSSLQYRTPASVYHAQVTGEQNDDTTGNQPDGAKLSYAYANVKVRPSGLQVKKSVEKAIFSPQTLTFAPPYRYGLLNGLNAEISLIKTKTQTIDERYFP